MSKTIFFTVLIVQTTNVLSVEKTDICDVCVCKYDTRTNQDLSGEVVDCSYNPLIFDYDIKLPITTHTLDFSTNNLTRVKKSSLLKSNSVTELFLNNNNLIEIETNAIQLPELKRLDLSFNDLEVVTEDVFISVKKLEYLNLANNKFTTFTKLSFHHLSNLNELLLDNNNLGHTLQSIDIFDRNGYGVTHKIKSVSLCGIRLNSVPDNFFSDAYDIKKIVIANNNITSVFQIPYTLEYFDVSDNPIEEIFLEDFLDLPALKTLKLNNLKIAEVPEYVFSSLVNLNHLELERNKNLTSFSPFAFGREVLEDPDDFRLEVLSLRGSRVSELDERLLEPFGQLTKLDLQGNPWKCDCNLVWLKKLQIQPNDYDHLRCALPRSFYNCKIFDLDTKYFVCPITRHLQGIGIAAIALCGLLASSALWLFLCTARRQTRVNYLQQMYPTAAYSILPVTRTEY